MKTLTKLKLTDTAIDKIKFDDLEFSYTKLGNEKIADEIIKYFNL